MAEADTVAVGAQTPERHAAIVPAVVVDAAVRARQIVLAAETRAREILDAAEAGREALEQSAREAGRAAAVAELAARSLALSRLEAEHDRRATARLIEVARLLAERLLGEALRLDPSHVVALAENALDEAGGARRITIVAHPDDATELEQALASGRLERVARVVPSNDRTRGSLRLETELGSLDAELAPQLDRLAQALRATLPHEP